MNDPYLILRVPRDAGDAEIRRAYLAGVRDFPPEREPERFQAIARAYEQICDARHRLEHRLFSREAPGESPAAVVTKYCAAAPPPAPRSFDEMKTFLRACSTK